MPIERGVVPIENVVQGTVRETYDLLLEHDLVIIGEVIVPVHLCLAALPGERLETIERVYSHIQALGQAESFLRSRPWSLLTTYNTAGAGKLIVDRQEHGAAAVLSPRAAAGFGLSILADAIQSVPDNRTRFLVVARPGLVAMAPEPKLAVGASRAAAPVAHRTTLVLAVKNEPGTLVRCLEVLAAAGLNMGKLESRPEPPPRLGVRLLGRARRRRRRSRHRGDAHRARARGVDGPRARLLPAGRRPGLRSLEPSSVDDRPARRIVVGEVGATECGVVGVVLA